MIIEIKGEDYIVTYNPETYSITCIGSLRLAGKEEYAPITELLEGILIDCPVSIVMDLSNLQFLNSSGINILSKFVIQVRQQASIQLTVRGAINIPWQGKSLKNLQRLMPSLNLEWLGV
ncbi:MAG: hypothetical protein WCO45_09535 [Pseudanabaena sp. ELA607]